MAFSHTSLSKAFVFHVFILFALSYICNGFYYGSTLYSGQTLHRHNSLVNGRYSLYFGADCRLEILDPNPEREVAVWESREKKDYGRCTCEMQYDGNLVVKGSNSWAALDEGKERGNYVLVLRFDRDLAIYGPALWSSGTQRKSARREIENHAVSLTADGQSKGYILYSDRYPLRTGEYLDWGRYNLKMQPDCNLVLYDKGDSIWDDPTSVWSTNTAGAGTNCYLQLMHYGNLVLYDGNKQVQWSTNVTSSRESTDVGWRNCVLILQDDGNMVVYDTPIWHTDTYDPFHPRNGIIASTADTITATNGIATVV